jgi:hypothetical protein
MEHFFYAVRFVPAGKASAYFIEFQDSTSRSVPAGFRGIAFDFHNIMKIVLPNGKNKSGEDMARPTEIPGKKSMLLMACVHRGEEMEEQRDVICDVRREMGSCLDVRVMDEEQERSFVKKFHVVGTPTYILFGDSEEKARLLGKVDAGTLCHFIRAHLNRDENQN